MLIAEIALLLKSAFHGCGKASCTYCYEILLGSTGCIVALGHAGQSATGKEDKW